MSEFGFQAFPSYETIKYINENDSLDISSLGFKNHQKHLRGFQLIDEYMARDFPVPINQINRNKRAEDYIYTSQLLQAYGMTKGIEAHRRAKPYNMGTLYWQLNDVWPAVSWSSIDFMGNWKALHYKAKRSFENVLVSSKVEGKVFKTWIVNDHLSEISGELNTKLIGVNGEVYWENNRSITVQENASQFIVEHDFSTIPFDKKRAVLVSTFNNQTSYSFFVKPKDLKLDHSKIKTTIKKTTEGFEIILSSEKFQKDVFLYTDVKGHFSDNFFNLLPNIPISINFKTEAKTFESLKFKSLNEFLE
jgi:beta-mannosidase